MSIHIYICVYICIYTYKYTYYRDTDMLHIKYIYIYIYIHGYILQTCYGHIPEYLT